MHGLVVGTVVLITVVCRATGCCVSKVCWKNWWQYHMQEAN